MIDGYIYKCRYCGEDYLAMNDCKQLDRVPCSSCGRCRLRPKQNEKQITAEKRAKDIYDEIQKFNGR